MVANERAKRYFEFAVLMKTSIGLFYKYLNVITVIYTEMANGLLDFEIRVGLKKTIFRYDATD